MHQETIPHRPTSPCTLAERRQGPAHIAAACLRGLALAFGMAVAALPAAADFIQVPGDFATIQEAIDAAPANAVIYVGPGRFVENLDFRGKALVVEGVGPESILDGGGVGPVVRFVSGEGESSVLDSFTITGGFGSTGGGIEVRNSSPWILRNVIVANSATASGSGIYVGGREARPSILNNLLVFNTGVEGGDPHTIQVDGSEPRIINNTIVRNDSNAILTSGFVSPEIRNNVLARNGTRLVGKGRGICDFASGTVTQYNHFFRNVRAALLTGGTDYRTIRAAENALGLARLAGNRDGALRFSAGLLPRTPAEATRERFIPSADPDRPSRLLHAGDPADDFRNTDGTRNTIGFTGGPFSPLP